MASRRIQVEILGDSRSLERAFGRSSASAKHFNRDVSKATRGALAGTGAFRSLGRSIAFASGGFLAFATVGEVLRKSVDAASEAAATERQLAAQFRASGVDLKNYREEIEKATLATSQISGFTRDELTQSFTLAFRGSNSVAVSLKAQAIAADVARGRHIGLQQATLALTKAYGGQATALRRLEILVPTNLKGLAALNFVAEKFAGQAQAGTTAQQRFAAALQNTEVTIGTALLPTLTRYLTSISTWLNSTEHQREIQRDLNQALRVTGKVLSTVGDGFNTVKPAFVEFGRIVGGITGKVHGLVSALRGVHNFTANLDQSVFGFLGLMKDKPAKIAPSSRAGEGTADRQPGRGPGGAGTFQAQARAAAVAAARGALGLSARFAKLQLALARAQLTKDERDDKEILGLQEQNLKDQLARRKLSLKERTALTQQLVSVEGQIAAIDDRAAGRARDAAKARADAAKRQREREKALRAAAATVRENRQFRALGLGPGGSALAPTKAALKKELGNVQDAVAGTFLDTNATRSVLSKIRKLMTGQLGALSADVRSTVKQMLDDLKSQLGEFDGFNLTKAEKRRRFLDKQLSGPVGGGGRSTQSRGRGGDQHLHVTVVQQKGESADAVARRAMFRARQAFAH